MSQVLRWPTKMPYGGLLTKGQETYDKNKGRIADFDAGCEQTLHISLFFDGTNNNDDKNNAFRDSLLGKSHTNVARLFRAARDETEHGIYRHYMPGVGTPFPEIGEREYSSFGKAFAAGYGRRCVWAYTRVLNSIYAAIAEANADPLIRDEDANTLCSSAADGYRSFSSLFDLKHKRLAGMQRDRERDSQRNKMVKKVWINVFGFSRGAAGARSFVGKLTRDWAPGGKIAGTIPYKINFMGLFDTVASVGPPDSVRGAIDISGFDGHFAWSRNGLMDIPHDVNYCAHFISIHEQRMSFPLDTIREGNNYPGSTGKRVEVAYPGVHSDVGGGYAAGDQGKARGGDGSKLSQITLHQMYIEALKQGVPLIIGDKIERSPYMKDDFALDKPVIDAFNDWLDRVIPISRVEDALRYGMRQNLAWRTLRARWRTGHYIIHQPFFKAAPEDGMTPHQLERCVESQLEADPESQKIRARIKDLAFERTALGLNGIGQGRYISAADRAAEMKEAAALEKKSQDAWDALRRRKEQMYQQAAGKKERTRPGEGADETLTNDQRDLREAAEEFRLLLGHLHPALRESLGVEKAWILRPQGLTARNVLRNLIPSGVTLGPVGKEDLDKIQLPYVGRENNPDSHRVVLVERDLHVQTAALTAMAGHSDPSKYDVLVVPAKDMEDHLRAWTAPAEVDKFATQEHPVVRLFDDYIHDSRAWFRVPYYHEYSPGGYGWGRVFFVGKDNCVRFLGLVGDAIVQSVNSAPAPSRMEMQMMD